RRTYLSTGTLLSLTGFLLFLHKENEMEADISLTRMALDINSGVFNRYKEDDKLAVAFFFSPVQDDEATAREGRPIFKDAEFIKILIPGDKTNVVVRQASQSDKDRFAQQYARFKNNQQEVLEGTPLEAWPLVTRSQVEELKYFGVRTVEQLAGMADV